MFGDICATADTLRVAAGSKLAVMISKDIEEFPENSERLTGTIDVWWIVRILSKLILGFSATVELQNSC